MTWNATEAVELAAMRQWTVWASQVPCGTRLQPDDLLSRVREANNVLLDVLGGEHPNDEIAFFCECASPACFAPVWLISADYAKRLASGRPIALPGHRAPVLPPDGNILPAHECLSPRRLSASHRAIGST
jgi:hypothetical protein